MPFFRIYKEDKNCELLLNSDHISKIVVKYVVFSDVDEVTRTRTAWPISLKEALNNPEAVRCYEVHVANEKITLIADPDDPVMKICETIYNAAIKA